MIKIDSREKLLQAMDDYGRMDSVVLMVDTKGIKLLDNTFGRAVREIVNPFHWGVIAGHTDFDDLPEEFFVDVHKVSTEYAVQDTAMYKAIMNTCINEENYWVFREFARFQHQEYEPINFATALASQRVLKPELVLHFPHASVEDPTMVAFTPSHEYGKRDRQVRMKVGKYLTKYYADVLSQESIRALANGAKGYTVKFATNYEEFRHVYEHGPSSCMSGGTGDFNACGDVHPVDVYDSGEFKLAYIAPWGNNIVARAFVHEPSKRWVRAYGDEADALANWLDENGYTKDSSWEGCHLKRITDGEDRWVLPYIDGDARGVREVSGGRWLIVSSRPYDVWCDFTGGVYENDEDMAHCGHCGNDVPEEDVHWSEYHDMHIGECCLDEYVTARWRGGVTLIEQGCCIYNNSDDEHYEEDYAINHLGLMQDYTGDWYHPDDLIRTTDGEYVYEAEAVLVGEDEDGDAYVHCREYISDLVVQYDGQQPIRVWDPQCMPEDIRALYDEDPAVTTDNGTSMGLRFRSFDEILLAMGPAHTERQLILVGFRFGLYTLNSHHERLTKIAA